MRAWLLLYLSPLSGATLVEHDDQMYHRFSQWDPLEVSLQEEIELMNDDLTEVDEVLFATVVYQLAVAEVSAALEEAKTRRSKVQVACSSLTNSYGEVTGLPDSPEFLGLFVSEALRQEDPSPLLYQLVVSWGPAPIFTELVEVLSELDIHIGSLQAQLSDLRNVQRTMVQNVKKNASSFMPGLNQRLAVLRVRREALQLEISHTKALADRYSVISQYLEETACSYPTNPTTLNSSDFDELFYHLIGPNREPSDARALAILDSILNSEKKLRESIRVFWDQAVLGFEDEIRTANAAIQKADAAIATLSRAITFLS